MVDLTRLPPILDTHQHLWDLSKVQLAWAEKAPQLVHDHLMSDYLEATKGLPIAATIYMEVDVLPQYQQAEAEYIFSLCEADDNPMKAAVLGLHPKSEKFQGDVVKLRHSEYFKGIRQVLHEDRTPPGYCLDEQFVKDIQFLGEQGLIFDLCMRSGELLDAVRLIQACPQTRFVLDHLGNPNVQAEGHDQWRKDVAEVAKCDRVMCKISGIVASAQPDHWQADDLAPFVNHCLDVFGPDRVMFGGDWPVCTLTATYRSWVEALAEIVSGRSEADQRKLFGENASKFYGVPL